MARPFLTDWLPPTVTPTRPGVYEGLFATETGKQKAKFEWPGEWHPNMVAWRGHAQPYKGYQDDNLV